MLWFVVSCSEFAKDKKFAKTVWLRHQSWGEIILSVAVYKVKNEL